VRHFSLETTKHHRTKLYLKAWQYHGSEVAPSDRLKDTQSSDKYNIMPQQNQMDLFPTAAGGNSESECIFFSGFGRVIQGDKGQLWAKERCGGWKGVAKIESDVVGSTLYSSSCVCGRCCPSQLLPTLDNDTDFESPPHTHTLSQRYVLVSLETSPYV